MNEDQIGRRHHDPGERGPGEAHQAEAQLRKYAENDDCEGRSRRN